MTRRTLIRGGTVLTMDPAIGSLGPGDVLVEGGEIVEVAPSVEAPADEVVEAAGKIVMPGMVDTHRHTWQTQVRAICSDWSLADYFQGIRLAVSPAYTAEDVHLGNYVGALEAVDAGVTTILDFSHCNNTPEHADAAIRGLQDAGIRAVYGYGFFESSPEKPSAFATHDARIADFERVSKSFPRGLLRLGAALTEIGLVPWTETVEEIRAARAHDARIVTHTGCVWGSVVTGGVRQLAAGGLLGPEQVHVHCNTLDDEEFALLAKARASVSISPETELNMGMGTPVFAQCRKHGLAPTLSCDIVSLNSGDLVSQARLGLAFSRWADNLPVNQEGRMPDDLTWLARDAVAWLTRNGAEACGLGSLVGTLSPGKRADVVIIGRADRFTGVSPIDAAGTVIFQTSPSDVDTVMIDGEIRKRDGKLVGVDVRLHLERLTASGERILSRVRAAVPALPPKIRGAFDSVEEVARRNLAGARPS